MTIEEKVKQINPFEDVRDETGKLNWCPCRFGLPDDCIDGSGNCEKCWSKEYIENGTEDRVEPATDPVNRPSHYTDGKIEVIDYIEDKKLGFCLGNAIKYISRAGKKDPSKEVEDLNKAIWYINRRIKEIRGGGDK